MSTRRFELHVKDKGRTVLPAALRAECGFETGTTLIARPLGKGRVIVETRDAILENIWAGIPGPDTDAVGALAEMRREDHVHAAAVSEPRADAQSDDRAAALLKALGLD